MLLLYWKNVVLNVLHDEFALPACIEIEGGVDLKPTGEMQAVHAVGKLFRFVSAIQYIKVIATDKDVFIQRGGRNPLGKGAVATGHGWRYMLFKLVLWLV